MASAAHNELAAALRFSVCIDSELKAAGTPDIWELSL